MLLIGLIFNPVACFILPSIWLAAALLKDITLSSLALLAPLPINGVIACIFSIEEAPEPNICAGLNLTPSFNNFCDTGLDCKAAPATANGAVIAAPLTPSLALCSMDSPKVASLSGSVFAAL
mgnify:CR=1 FL=1